MATDRLSALPDRVLHRVLSFLDVRDAPRTSALARRWRTLWLQADAITLDSRTYRDSDYDGKRVGRLLFRDALAAVRTGGRCPVRKLSVDVDSYFQSDYLEGIMRTSPGMDAVLAAPAMQGLEELRVVLHAEFCQTGDEYVLPQSRLPWKSLRVLELTGGTLGPPPPPAGKTVFGRLQTLRMVECNSSLENLQAMLDAAPNLGKLWLEHVSFKSEELGHNSYAVMSRRRVLLRCPNAMVAVGLIHCHTTDGLDLDAPNVRSLRYTGFLEHFPFSSTTPTGPPMNLQHAELSFCTPRCCYNHPSREAQPHVVFWKSIGSFSHLKVLKLELEYIKDIGIHSEDEDVLLKVFPELNFLELEGSCQVDSYGAAVAIANLLHCCPAIQEFRVKLKLHRDPYAVPNRMIDQSEKRRAQLNLEKSMNLLARLKSEKAPYSGVDDNMWDDVDLSALKACSFLCLDSHLRKIRLEFELECFDCFEAKLAKFLVENAVVLEEMEVHDGDQRVYDHIHHKLAQWRANSFRSRINICG